MARCDEEHPEIPKTRCAKEEHPYGSHYDGHSIIWEGQPAPVRIGTRGKSSRLVDAASRAHLAIRQGPPAQSGPPVASIAAWRERQEDWLNEARAALQKVCREHDRFTTREVWALVDAPFEKRAMVLVVRHGIRMGWMYEIAAERAEGVYTTRDKVSFPLNKLVPIYKSNIYLSQEQT